MPILTGEQQYNLDEILRRALRAKQLSTLLDDMQYTRSVSLHTPSSGTVTVQYDYDQLQYIALNAIIKDLLKADKAALAELVR